MFVDTLEKAGLNAVAAGAATWFLFGKDANVFVPFVNGPAPLYALSATAGAVGSIAGDLTHQTVKSEIHISEKAQDSASLFLGLGINGALFSGLLYLYDPQVLSDFGALKAFGVGAAAEFAGSSSYAYLKQNLYL